MRFLPKQFYYVIGWKIWKVLDEKVELVVLTLVDLSTIRYCYGPFIMAIYAKQVFYIQDPKYKRLYVTLTSPPREFYDE